MVKEEIVTGLRNAILNGESLEKAMQSMINAGYGPQEVQEASQYAGMGVTGSFNSDIPKLPPIEESKTSKEVSVDKTMIQGKSSSLNNDQKPKGSKNLMKVLILAAVLLILLGVLGFVLFRMLK